MGPGGRQNNLDKARCGARATDAVRAKAAAHGLPGPIDLLFTSFWFS